MFTSVDELLGEALMTPFPDNGKVRLSIAGLAYCELGIPSSKINFLTHVLHHAVWLTIQKRIRNSTTAYPAEHHKINDGDTIDISVERPLFSMSSFKMDGNFALEEMLNMNTIHRPGGGKVISPKAPSPPPAPRPAVVTLNHCRFFTRSIHNEMFKLTEGVGGEPFDHIGYVMGGLIERTDANKSKVTITRRDRDGNPLPTLEFPATDKFTGKEFVYEIVIDNHCTNDTECQKQVEIPGSPGKFKTDFSFYYDVLEETDAPLRKFVLEQRELPAGAPVTTMGGSTIVAACNPVITDPPEPYG